jgi:hypothetical protein
MADGSLLEVKRDGVASKKSYASVEAWCESVALPDRISGLSLEKNIKKPSPESPSSCTPDIHLIKKIYSSVHKTPAKMTRYISNDILYDESEKLLAEAVSQSNQDKVEQIKKWQKDNHVYAASYKGLQGWTYRYNNSHWYVRGSPVCYVKQKGTLKPVYVCTVTKDTTYISMVPLFDHMYRLPMKNVLYFNGKYGETFESVGIPLDEDGTPNLWSITPTDYTSIKKCVIATNKKPAASTAAAAK